jgi:MFS family permease
MFTRLNNIYHEFPHRFWIVVGTSFIDGIGNTLLFPFFALYIAQKFHIGMTQAGVLLGLSSLAGMFGGILGGALIQISPSLPEFFGVAVLIAWYFFGLPIPPENNS